MDTELMMNTRALIEYQMFINAVAHYYKEWHMIMDELENARKKHPDFPKDDVIHMTAIMAEEAGEAIQAANDVVYGDKSLEPLRRELAQTAAMCIRCLVNLEDRA